MILGRSALTVQRVAAGSFTAGRFVDGATSTLTILGSWQPMTGRAREQLPELHRTRETAKLLCDPTQTRLSPVDVATKTRQDVIVRASRRYEIIAVEDWTDHAGPTAHIAYTVALIDADEEARR